MSKSKPEDKQYHYVYKIILAGSKKYYIGRHSTDNGDFLNDGYWGSGNWTKQVKDKSRLSKIILAEYDTYEELELSEEKFILEHFDDYNCMNYLKSSSGFRPGHVMSEETLHKLSIARSGKNNPNYGKPRSEETKKKISDIKRGKYPGELCVASKLKEEQVLEIRRLYEAGDIFQKQLAEKYNVSQYAISKIITRKSWNHI